MFSKKITGLMATSIRTQTYKVEVSERDLEEIFGVKFSQNRSAAKKELEELFNNKRGLFVDIGNCYLKPSGATHEMISIFENKSDYLDRGVYQQLVYQLNDLETISPQNRLFCFILEEKCLPERTYVNVQHPQK